MPTMTRIQKGFFILQAIRQGGAIGEMNLQVARLVDLIEDDNSEGAENHGLSSEEVSASLSILALAEKSWALESSSEENIIGKALSERSESIRLANKTFRTKISASLGRTISEEELREMVSSSEVRVSEYSERVKLKTAFEVEKMRIRVAHRKVEKESKESIEEWVDRLLFESEEFNKLNRERAAFEARTEEKMFRAFEAIKRNE